MAKLNEPFDFDIHACKSSISFISNNLDLDAISLSSDDSSTSEESESEPKNESWEVQGHYQHRFKGSTKHKQRDTDSKQPVNRKGVNIVDG